LKWRKQKRISLKNRNLYSIFAI